MFYASTLEFLITFLITTKTIYYQAKAKLISTWVESIEFPTNVPVFVYALHTANLNLAQNNSAFRECNGIVLSFVRHNDSLIARINRQSCVERSTAPGAL